MPLLIGLLIFFGSFALGSFVGSAAVAVVGIVFTAPSAIYNKLFPGKAGAVPFGFAFWLAVFGILYLCGKLTALNVIGLTVVSFIIGIIGLVCYSVLDEFFHFSEMVKKNCIRCGKPFNWTPHSTLDALCRTCQAVYDGMLEREIQKQNKTVACSSCNGSGKIKGYKCVHCKGRGSFPRGTDDIARTAKLALKDITEWAQERKKLP